MASPFPTDQDMLEIRQHFHDSLTANWLYDDFLSLNWWLLLLVMLISWVIWWKLLDKNRLMELLLYGSLISVVATVLDELGTSFVLWHYEDSLLPTFTPLFIFDMVQVPVAYTLIYQFFPRWKSYFFATTALAALYAYGMEELLKWLAIYRMVTWEHTYSFVIYITIGMLLKWIMHKIMGYQHRISQQ